MPKSRLPQPSVPMPQLFPCAPAALAPPDLEPSEPAQANPEQENPGQADHGPLAHPLAAPVLLRDKPAPAGERLRKLPRGVASSAGMLSLRIAVEGPLRVGKSTLARLLAERMGASHIAEPEGNPFLPRFYAGEPGMAFAAQMWFLRERIAQQKAAAALRGPVVSDYMLEKDKLFAFLNLSDAELAIYKDFYAANAVTHRPDLVVYLQASPSVLVERRRRKGVSGERAIGEAYTNHVCEAYEHFFTRYSASRLLVVDTSAIDFVHSERERELLLDRILAPVHGREYFAPLAHIA